MAIAWHVLKHSSSLGTCWGTALYLAILPDQFGSFPSAAMETVSVVEEEGMCVGSRHFHVW